MAVVLVAMGLAGTAACSGSAAGSGRSTGSPAATTASPAASPAESPTPSPSTVPTPANALTGKTIVIDPGHNGQNHRHPEVINRQVDVITKKKACDTTGTQTTSGYTEAAFTWDVSQRLAVLLRQQGAEVTLTRGDNSGVGPCITDRAKIGNEAKADAAISVHADGAPVGKTGFHMILPKRIDGPVAAVVNDSQKLGLAVRDAVHTHAGLPYSNYAGKQALNYRDDLGGLNLSTVPKVFIECGNMKDPGDAAKLTDPAVRARIAAALAKGLADYLA